MGWLKGPKNGGKGTGRMSEKGDPVCSRGFREARTVNECLAPMDTMVGTA
jgi:hypothetical protein